MSSTITLQLDKRTAEGKAARKLRADGIIPSVVYGHGVEPISTQSAEVITTKAVHGAGKHAIINLTIGGKTRPALVKSIDIDPVKHIIRHVAFHAVKADEKVTTDIPVVLDGTGESPAERAGLIVLQALEALEIEALPADLPEALHVSIAELAEAGDKILISDITLPKNVTFTGDDLELTVASVYEPSALQAANDAAGGDAEDAASVDADNGGDTPQNSQAEETKPGGKLQDQPKQSNVDANK